MPKSNAERSAEADQRFCVTSLSTAFGRTQSALNFSNNVRAVKSSGAQCNALSRESREQRVADFINIRNLPQEHVYLFVPFDRLSDRGLNLLDVLADEFSVDSDSDGARFICGLKTNHFRRYLPR